MKHLIKYLIPLILVSTVLCILLVLKNQWNVFSYIIGSAIGTTSANIDWIAAKEEMEEND